MKRVRYGSNKARWFFLFNDCLIYAKTVQVPGFIDVNHSHRYTYIHTYTYTYTYAYIYAYTYTYTLLNADLRCRRTKGTSSHCA